MITQEINNKHYRDAKVVMLSTNKLGVDGDLVLNNNVSNPHKLFYCRVNCNVSYQQHLYITSNEEIKEGDWCLLDNNVGESVGFEVKKCLEADIINGEYTFKENNGNLFTTGRCDKIIATTDSSLGLPQLSKEFIQSYIESYNNGNVIEDVLVEVEFINHVKELKKRPYYPFLNEDYRYNLKLKDNTIIIKNNQDDWNDIYKKYCSLNYNSLNKHTSHKSYEQWLKENYHSPIKKIINLSSSKDYNL